MRPEEDVPGISCAAAEVLLAARAGGALTPASEPALLQHLESCAVCRGLAEELQSPDVADALADAAREERDLAELTVVDSGHYVLGAEIGRGGMGRIVRAHDRRLGRAVAIKELIDERLQSRFEAEARLTARLQHPSIVSVHEVGRWPNGAPFYSMKYIAGRPLGSLVANMRSSSERLALVPNLLAAAEAMAYAHSQRIVHRDLKPDNILVGAFGETVIIDWGLAKDLSAPAGSDGPYRGTGGSGDLTEAGAGTPVYMPPEQARGEPPDERVDVYALGATLHHVLAGDRPDRAPLPEETPIDLRAIVTKAMANVKEDRYRTAAELASELRRFQNGQLVAAHRYTALQLARRWLRRHRGLVAVSAAFVAALAGVAGASVHRIVAERDRAEAERRGAEQLVDYMLGSLRARLEPIGKLDVLAGVGREVERYFASIPAASERDVKVLRDRGRALSMLAKIDGVKGNFDDSRAESERSLALCERWGELAPSADAASCAVTAIEGLAAIASFRGDTDAAMELWRRAGARLDSALARSPGDVALRRARGDVQYFLGRELLKRRDHDAARVAFLAGLEPTERLVADLPSDDDAVDVLATLRAALGELECEAGFPDVALRHYDAAAELRDRLRRRQPDDAGAEVLWALESGAAAAPATLMGDFGLARARLEPALGVLRRRAAADPDNALWRSYLSTLEWRRAANELAAGRLDEAARSASVAAAELTDLVRRDPTRESAALNLAGAESTLAAIDLARGDAGAARLASERAGRVAREWSGRQPGKPIWLLAEAEADLRYAEGARADGRIDDARAAALTAVGLAAATSSRRDLQVERLVARGLLALGEDTEGLRALVDRLVRDVERWPEVVELRARLAEAELALAEALERGPGAGAEARWLRERARQALEPLAERGALPHELGSALERARSR